MAGFLALFRAPELLLAAYFCYTTVLAFALPVSATVTRVTVGMNALVLGGLVLAACADARRRGKLLAMVRDWCPPPLALLGYREMGWFALPHTSTALEESWVVWDKLLLHQWGLQAALESLGPLLPAILELTYTLVYPMGPFALGMLYLYGRRERSAALMFQFTLAVLPVYALFPFFPSEPPWTVFPGQDYPAYDTPFRRVNAVMLESQGIHTSVFPSAHVAGSMSVALAMMRLLPERKWVGRLLLTMAISITLATVYGRYHYAVDAVAGLAFSLAASWIAARRRGVSRS